MAPSMSGIASIAGLVMRVLQFIFAVTVMGIAAYLCGHNNGYSTAYGYNVFVGVWTIIALIYLSFTTYMMENTGRMGRIVTVAVEAVTWVFWLAAWASFANNLNSNDCHGNTSCQRVKGGLGVGIVEWVLFTATLVLAVLGLVKGQSDFKSRGTASNGV